MPRTTDIAIAVIGRSPLATHGRTYIGSKSEEIGAARTCPVEPIGSVDATAVDSASG